MRVLHVDAGREWRGGQTQLLALVRRIGGPVVVHPCSPLRPALEAAGVETHTVGFRGRWGGGAALARVIRACRPDLVAAHDGHGAALAVRWSPVPVVVHRRVDFVPSGLGARRYRQAAGVIAVSRAVADRLGAKGVVRVAVVHDGVDPEPIDRARADRAGIRAALGLPFDTVLVGAVGALVAHKAHHVFVRALAELPGVHGVVLGEGPLRASLAALASRTGVPLHLVGHRADVGRWLKSLDVFVHPSVGEGFGQGVVEAALAGVPSVVSQAGGLPETGLGIPFAPGDTAALARGIRRARAGTAPVDRQDLLARFGVDRMVTETLRAYATWI